MTISSSAPSIKELSLVLQQYSVEIDDSQLPALCRYCELLWRWNTKLNLTRHTDLNAFVTRDLIDSLRLSRHIPADQSVLDVGSGGGVPGIILAVTRPDMAVSLAESVAKKAKALSSITKKMKLNLPVHASRAEDVLKKKSFDVMTIRAVASLRKLLFWFQKKPDAFGQMLLIKGPRWVEEQKEAEEEGLLTNAIVEKIDEYATPGHDNNSVILSVRFKPSPAN